MVSKNFAYFFCIIFPLALYNIFLKKVFLHEITCLLRLMLINTLFHVLVETGKSVFIFSALFDKPVSEKLCCLNSLFASIAIRIPFKKRFLWMRLNCKNRLFFCLYNCNKLFFIGCCRIEYCIPKIV